MIDDRALTDVRQAARVWDTEHNNGVLIYMLLAEHEIDILADRALAKRVPAETWRRTIDAALADFRQGRIEGLNTAMDDVHALLVRHFPRALADDEDMLRKGLPDRPVIG